jgi:2-polyprenyl-3-methyl-5-hydroxy-6-metoxy-1,4-benzoquinol methylase
MTDTPPQDLADSGAVEAAKAWEIFGKAWLGTQLVITRLVPGYRSGLLAAVVAEPGTAEQLAARAGTDPRMTLEWLRAMTVDGLLDHEKGVFAARPELDEILEVPGIDSPADIVAATIDRLPELAEELTHALRTGNGTPPQLYEPEITRLQNLSSLMDTAPYLVADLLGPVDGLTERLTGGCRVVEVGCGGGSAIATLAEAYPQSTFVGYDIDEHALGLARARLAPYGDRCSAHRLDVMDLDAATADVVLLLDVLHDLPDPAGALGVIRSALAPGGLLVVAEADASGDFEVDRHSPLAQQYASSYGRCVPGSQRAGGPAVGAMWGRPAASHMIERAGFAVVGEHSSTPSGHVVFTCRPTEY